MLWASVWDRTARNPLLSGSKGWYPAPNWVRSGEMSQNPSESPSECSRAMQLHDQPRKPSPAFVAVGNIEGPRHRALTPSQPLEAAGGKQTHAKTSSLVNTGATDASFPVSLCFVLALGKCGLLCYTFQSRWTSPKAKKKEGFPRASLHFQRQPCSICPGSDASQAPQGCLYGEKAPSLHHKPAPAALAVCSS